jgi:hypothetical protein
MQINEINLEAIFNEIIEKLKKDERPKIMLTPEIIQKIKDEWNELLKLDFKDNKRLHQILCILDNSHNYSREFQDLLLTTLKKAKDKDTIIYTLTAIKKHIIEENLKNGIVLPLELMNSLKELIKSKEPEVVEWTLRTIDSMGPFGLRLRDEVLKHRPGISAFFNKHKQNSLEIIDHLEKQWNEFKRK